MQEELSVLLTDVHQHKRNLEELFSKLVNNKSRIAVSATCQESCHPGSLVSHTAPGAALLLVLPSLPPLLLFSPPWEGREGLSPTLSPEAYVLHGTLGLNLAPFREG